MFSVTYVCPECGSTKVIKNSGTWNADNFFKSLPSKVPCGVRGCESYAYLDPQREEE